MCAMQEMTASSGKQRRAVQTQGEPGIISDPHPYDVLHHLQSLVYGRVCIKMCLRHKFVMQDCLQLLSKVLGLYFQPLLLFLNGQRCLLQLLVLPVDQHSMSMAGKTPIPGILDAQHSASPVVSSSWQQLGRVFQQPERE